jgi:hypothetical protein
LPRDLQVVLSLLDQGLVRSDYDHTCKDRSLRLPPKGIRLPARVARLSSFFGFELTIPLQAVSLVYPPSPPKQGGKRRQLFRRQDVSPRRLGKSTSLPLSLGSKRRSVKLLSYTFSKLDVHHYPLIHRVGAIYLVYRYTLFAQDKGSSTLALTPGDFLRPRVVACPVRFDSLESSLLAATLPLDGQLPRARPQERLF